MRGTPLNLPKWRLLLVVFGVFLGQAHQIVCKAGAHATRSTAAAVESLSADDDAGGDRDGASDTSCVFHCQFHGKSLALQASFALPARILQTVSRISVQQDEATSRSSSIDLPPQIA